MPLQLLRGAGCTINDMWDRKLDAQVERTRYRPLAAGVLSLPQATAFLAAQLSLGLGVLLQLNPFCQAVCLPSLVLISAYPTMKRFTAWVCPSVYLLELVTRRCVSGQPHLGGFLYLFWQHCLAAPLFRTVPHPVPLFAAAHAWQVLPLTHRRSAAAAVSWLHHQLGCFCRLGGCARLLGTGCRPASLPLRRVLDAPV